MVDRKCTVSDLDITCYKDIAVLCDLCVRQELPVTAAVILLARVEKIVVTEYIPTDKFILNQRLRN